MSLRVVPLTLPKANECVRMWHRHHAPLPGGFAWYCLGAVEDGRIVAAAICGRPTNRNAEIITYTLDSESGSSLRAAGWNRDKDGIQSWWTHAGSRTPAVSRDHHGEKKIRWSLRFRDRVEAELPAVGLLAI